MDNILNFLNTQNKCKVCNSDLKKVALFPVETGRIFFSISKKDDYFECLNWFNPGELNLTIKLDNDIIIHDKNNIQLKQYFSLLEICNTEAITKTKNHFECITSGFCSQNAIVAIQLLKQSEDTYIITNKYSLKSESISIIKDNYIFNIDKRTSSSNDEKYTIITGTSTDDKEDIYYKQVDYILNFKTDIDSIKILFDTIKNFS